MKPVLYLAAVFGAATLLWAVGIGGVYLIAVLIGATR